MKRVITKVDRYLKKVEARETYKTLLLYKDITEENLKIHKITNKAYMIELIEVPAELKNKIKKDIEVIDCTVYKTNDTLEELKSRQKNRETVQALQQIKAQGEAI